MKHEFSTTQPDYLIEDWPTKYDTFSWLEFVVTVPNPIFLITSNKENGKPNANLQSWGFPVGDRDNYSFLTALLDGTHTLQNILRTGEFCVNYPSFQVYPACFETIHKNRLENDEIRDAGLTPEPAQVVNAPRIAECFFNLECRLEWNRPILPGSRWQTLLARIVHVAVDEKMMIPEPEERARRMELMYNMRGNVNALTGEYYGPNTLALINKIVKIFPDR